MKIKEMKANNIEIQVYQSCGMEASGVRKLNENIHISECLVCNFSSKFVIVKCRNESCDECIKIEGEDFTNCKKYGTEICKFNLLGILKESLNIKDRLNDPLDRTDIGCSICGCSERVIPIEGDSQRGENYFCTVCFYIGDETRCCEYCGTPQIGGDIPEYSALEGCNICPGNPQWRYG